MDGPSSRAGQQRFAADAFLAIARAAQLKPGTLARRGHVVWMPSKPPAPGDVARLVSGCGVSLPEAYLTYLALTGGGEGELSVEPGWIQFWSADRVLALNLSYEVPVNLPGLFGFGSSGGGELFAFDLRGSPNCPAVVMMPFIPMEAAAARTVASTFEALLKLLPAEAREPAPGR